MSITVEKLFENDEIRINERNFLEDILEAIPLIDSTEEVGNSVEYRDEDGTVLFCVDLLSDNTYMFRFYEAEYVIDEETLQKIKNILK